MMYRVARSVASPARRCWNIRELSQPGTVWVPPLLTTRVEVEQRLGHCSSLPGFISTYRLPVEHPELTTSIPPSRCEMQSLTSHLLSDRCGETGCLLQVFPAVIPCHGNSSHISLSLSPSVFPPLPLLGSSHFTHSLSDWLLADLLPCRIMSDLRCLFLPRFYFEQR